MLFQVTLHAKKTMPDLQRYLLKFCLIKYELFMYIFSSFHLQFLFVSGLRISCLYEETEKLLELKTFRVRKTTIYSIFSENTGKKKTLRWGYDF